MPEITDAALLNLVGVALSPENLQRYAGEHRLWPNDAAFALATRVGQILVLRHENGDEWAGHRLVSLTMDPATAERSKTARWSPPPSCKCPCSACQAGRCEGCTVVAPH